MSEEQQIARDPFYDMVPERVWLCLSNIPTQEQKFKVTLDLNGQEKTLFHSYVHDGIVSESHNLTWLLLPLQAQLADARAELELLRRVAEAAAKMVKYCTALETGSESDCNIWMCRETRAALRAWGARGK